MDTQTGAATTAMHFLLEVFIFLLAALVVVPICRRLGLSAVLGYLLAGILIGPNGVALIGHAEEMLHFSELGIVLLLFIIGLELRPSRLMVMRRAVFGLGTSQVAVTALLVGGIVWGFVGIDPAAAALIGFAFALSSTAFVLQLLGETNQLNHPHGRAAFGVLLFQDVAVIPAIAIVNLVAPAAAGGHVIQPLALLLVGAGVVVARLTLRPMLRIVAATGIHELFLAASLAIVIGAALAMQEVGLSMGLGAFVAGVLVADSEYRHQLEADVTPFKGLFLGLFFISVGMSTDLGLLVEMPLHVLALAGGLVLLKTAAMVPVGLFWQLGRADALRAAIVLSQGGEFAFVLLSAAAGSLIETALVELLILVITLSMVTTPFLAQAVEWFLNRAPEERAFDSDHPTESHVVIAGFGRMGQIIARVLTMRGIPFTALDASPGHVDFVRKFGNETYYGDATRLDLLHAAHVGRTKAFVIAVSSEEASLKIASMLRETWPHIEIIARARNRQHELKLRELGVRHVLRETLLSSLALSEALLQVLGDSPAEARHAIDTFRRHDSRTIERQLAVLHDEEAFRSAAMDAQEELQSLFDADQDLDDDEVRSPPH